MTMWSNLKCTAFRLSKGAEAKQALLDLAKTESLKAPFVLSCVGSVSEITIRYADSDTAISETTEESFTRCIHTRTNTPPGEPPLLLQQEATGPRPPRQRTETLQRPLEVVSLSGNLSGERGHLHVTVADSEGRVTGGHLVGGMVVATTLEVVLADITGLEFTREKDPTTGYPELCVAAARKVDG